MTKGNKSNSSSQSGIERRKAIRRPILSTFSVFIAIPKKGLHRLQVHDMSELGIGFDLDVEGEELSAFPVKEGDPIEFRLYLNNTLFLPLTVQVKRVEEYHAKRRVGAEFQKQSSTGYKAFLSFLKMIDEIANTVQFDSK